MRVTDEDRRTRSREFSVVSARPTSDVSVARSKTNARPSADSLASRPDAYTKSNTPSRTGLRLVQGGAPSSAVARGCVTKDANGRRRLDLGPSAAERLRSGRETTRRR